MYRKPAISLLFALLLISWYAASPAFSAGNYVAIVNIDGTIDPMSARYLSRSINKGVDEGAELLVIKLNTPGGLLSSTRDMVEAILGAEIPIVVYVSPPGARAASAGTFITAAANFAVMAPGTNIGAASPVAGGGQDLPSTLAKKINEDTRAFIRSIAQSRNRNPQALEETVTLARSYSASEAVELNVVNFTATDLNDLLAQLDGRTAQTAGGPVTLQTRDLAVREIKPTLLENFLNVVTNPNVAFLLLTIGGLAILAEMLTPGVMGPGIVGVICLGLAFLGLGHLPVNWLGVGLVLFAMVLFFLEMQEPGLGIFVLGGIISLVLGSMLLFGGIFSTPDIPDTDINVSLWIIGGVCGLIVAGALSFRFLSRRTGSSTGYMSGPEGGAARQLGIAVSDLTPSGRVLVDGEEWSATTDLSSPIREGEKVQVVGVYGGVLKVSRVTYEGP
jgi:membrane-bound serine protease (ClpP class)